MYDNKLSKILYDKVSAVLDNMKKNPDSVTEHDKDLLNSLYSKICKSLGISEHSQWRVEWRVEKWSDTARKLAGFEPDEVAIDTQNIIVDTGAEEMLKLIAGISGATAFSNANAYIYVGNDNTAEAATDTGIKAQAPDRAFAKMDSGYPAVNGRQVVYRASFGDDVANFAWNEASITNGNGVSAIAMNRKVASLGTKVTGTWTIQITVSLVSA